MAVEPEWLDSPAASARIGVSIDYLRRLRRMGLLTPKKAENGHNYLWLASELDEYVRDHPRLGIRKHDDA